MSHRHSTLPAAERSPDAQAPCHPAFERLRSQPIASLNLMVEEYRHRATGAQHYHLVADNPENVFLVAFRTVPTDSTGVAHILEHTVLCGSERYPVRDPFFMMIRRSLNTFMNAFTSSDWTAYPFASQNRKDFYNLLDVYLDAVFFSRLHELDFAQEGHRVEFERPDDPTSPLVYKGVVFNEMKGAMSSPVSALWQTLTSHLYPTSTYHYNSGGEPEAIPDLSYEQLKAFYRSHYHPSNAVFMTYGDLPAQELHARFEDAALSRFERLDARIAVGDEQRFDAPRVAEEAYALDEVAGEGGHSHVVLAWLLGSNTDCMELLRAHLLSSVLLDNGACPLRHALETTTLGSAPSPLCGLEDSNHEMSFICGLEGCDAERAEAVEELVLGVLQRVAEEGIERDKIDSALHQLELHQREISGDGYPYGLQLLLEGLPAAIHRGDPVALLNLDASLERLRAEIEDPAFVKRLVRQWLLDNPHRVRLTLRPDTGLSKRRDAEERQRLAALAAGLSAASRGEIIARAESLAARQAQEDDPEALPKVTLEDIPADIAIPVGESRRLGAAAATVFDRPTNGLVYCEVVAALPQLDAELLAAAPLYTTCLTELGCGGRDYLETQAWQDAVCGGIDAAGTVRGDVADEQRVSGHFVLSGKALTRNHAKLAELMHATYAQPRFDEFDRIREVVAKERARAEQSVTHNGHRLAMIAACSGMSPQAALTHRLEGLAGIGELKRLDDGLNDKARVQALAEAFASLHRCISGAPRQFVLVSEGQHHDSLLADLQREWSDVVEAPGFEDFSLAPLREPARQLWVTSTQVNFCAKAYPTVSPEHADAPALTVLGGFLRNGYLHRAVREQGGAYGGGAGHDGDIAAFRFFSYRDPRLLDTLADFDAAVDWLLGGKHEWRLLEEAILGVIGAIDKPGSPAGEATRAFHDALYGRTAEQRRRFRSRVLDVSLEDLRRVGETYLKAENASVAVITNETTLDQIGDLGMQVQRL